MYGLVILLSALTATEFEVKPVELSWERYQNDWFETRWVLSPMPEGSADSFLERMKEAAPAGELGDLVRESDALSTDRLKHEKFLTSTLNNLSPGLRQLSPWLGGLLRENLLATSDWDPDEDSPDDGIVHGPAFDAMEINRSPWTSLSGDTTVHSAAVLIRADLEAIKEAENDYRRYYDNIDSSFETIYPIRNRYVRGGDDGVPFAGTSIRFTCDLPFPFTTYSCDLQTLSRLDAEGRMVTDIYTKSDDFYWLAGRDTYLPVRDSAGAWVATLVVRFYGFDLKGVPDGDGHRKAGLRSSLGHLKLRAEKLFAAANTEPRTVEGAIPEFEVRGRR